MVMVITRIRNNNSDDMNDDESNSDTNEINSSDKMS